MGEVVADVRQVLDIPVFTISSTTVTLLTLVITGLIVVATVVISRLAQRAVRNWIGSRGAVDSGTISTIARLVHYLVLAIGFGSALQTMGISLGTLFAAGAFFAIAIGFAMQSIAQNFVSGIILLAERTIKPGDVLEVEGRVVRVTAMHMR
ncbi:MAG: mechanosensitive ion channel domain-containing protein, partial [Longimicrobiales bacterium]